MMVETTSDPDQYHDPVLCKNIDLSKDIETELSLALTNSSFEDHNSESFDQEDESQGERTQSIDTTNSVDGLDSGADSSSTSGSGDTLTPNEIIRQFRVKKRLLPIENPLTISSPYRNLIKHISLDSSPLTEFSDNYHLEVGSVEVGSVEVVPQLNLPELTARNYSKYRNDYICGVKAFRLLETSEACVNNLNCKDHKLHQKLTVQRSMPLGRLLLAEQQFSSVFSDRRELILRWTNQSTFNQVVSRYEVFGTNLNCLNNDKIVLGGQVPLTEGVDRRKKRKALEAQGPKVGQTFARQVLRESDKTNRVFCITKTPIPSPMAPISSPKAPIGQGGSQPGLTEASSITTTATTSATSLQTTSSGSLSSSDTNSRTKEFVENLSKNTDTRIIETIAYLHYKLRRVQSMTIPKRSRELAYKFKVASSSS